MASPLYSTSVGISSFLGLNQSGDGYNMDMRYAREMENVDVSGGGFKPMRAGIRLGQSLTNPIGTLAYLHRRYGANTGTVLVAISDGKVYTKNLDGDDDWVQRYSGIADNDCDWVTYEVNTYAAFSASKTYVVGERVTHEETVDNATVTKAYKCTTAITTAASWNSSKWTEVSLTDPVDVLLFSNATDGMFCLYGDDLSVAPVATPENFGVIARYNERIWGAGIEGDPDKLMYSAPYDPFDWAANAEIPEDGAGDILQPTWDGDYFVSLHQYGSDLLAIKRNSIWRIYGTNPGEFSMQKQYGGGTIEENTFAIQDNYAYMMGEYGMMRYDGTGAYAFNQEAMHVLMRERVSRKIDTYGWPTWVNTGHYFPGDKVLHNGVPYRCRETTNDGQDPPTWDTTWDGNKFIQVDAEPIHNACAGMWNGVYCLALPLDGSDRCNAILQFDPRAGTISLRTGVTVDAFLQINERLFYTSADYPGIVYEMDDTHGNVKYVKWVSGWQDLGLKNSIKSGFLIYMMVETQAPLKLGLGLRTERKLKRKEITVKPGKMCRVHLNNHGREFRLEIESLTAVPFAIAGGIKIELELDPD